MKNSIVYYLAIFIPLIILYNLLKSDSIDATLFVICLFIYAFIYRNITDYFRLLSRHVIEKKDFWKLFIPGAKYKYFISLYAF
jgi:hypothetical protein